MIPEVGLVGKNVSVIQILNAITIPMALQLDSWASSQLLSSVGLVSHVGFAKGERVNSFPTLTISPRKSLEPGLGGRFGAGSTCALCCTILYAAIFKNPISTV